jgi:hypothetical protein
MSERNTYKCLCALVIVAAIVPIGCQSTSKKLASVKDVAMPWEGKKEPRKGSPDRVVGTWTEAVRHNTEVGGERGFGGRLFFYDRQGTDPIRVEGQLVVYAFVEDGRISTDHRPTRRYVFPPQQFVKHESESEVGVSYSVWLPWDKVGGEEADVSLIARFEPLQGGGLVVGDQTRHRLPGHPKSAVAQVPSNNIPGGKVQPAHATTSDSGGVVSAAANIPATETGIDATTIPLPRGFERHLSPSRRIEVRIPQVTRPQAPTPPPTSRATSPTRTSASANGTYPATGSYAMPATMQTETLATPGVAQQSIVPDNQMQLAQPVDAATKVTLLTPGESVRQRFQGQSFGFQPPSHLVPAKPASPSEVAR